MPTQKQKHETRWVSLLVEKKKKKEMLRFFTNVHNFRDTVSVVMQNNGHKAACSCSDDGSDFEEIVINKKKLKWGKLQSSDDSDIDTITGK